MTPRSQGLHVWLKINSGMNRAGIRPQNVQTVFRRLQVCEGVSYVTLMNHFARADEPGDDSTMRELAVFEKATKALPGDRSLANSAGILAWPAARLDWGRAGIALYGSNPVPKLGHQLDPVMTLESEIFAVRDVLAGESVGYGAGFTAGRRPRIGLIAMGCADGSPRFVPSGAPVIVDGGQASIAGRVSMDMLTVDIAELPRADIGSKVELWGQTASVDYVARAAGTISYELLCHVQRVPRV